MARKLRDLSSLVEEEQKFLNKAIDELKKLIKFQRSKPADVGANRFDTLHLGEQNLRDAAILEQAQDNAFVGSFINIAEDGNTNYHIGLAYVEL